MTSESAVPPSGSAAEAGFEVLVATDLRVTEGAAELASELVAYAESGGRVGLLAVSGPLIGSVRPANRHLRRLVERGQVELVVGGSRITARSLVVRHPAVDADSLNQLPPLSVDRVVVDTTAAERSADEGARQLSRRLAEMLGIEPTWAPTADSAPERAQKRPEAAPLVGSRKPRVLLMSSNGAGMGHLTRLLAYARRLEANADVSFLSLSQAAPLVARFGFGFEYLPSVKALSMPQSVWQRMYVDRVSETIARIRPDVVVFDGTWPYDGALEIREAFPSTQWVWSRRGMWRAGVSPEQIQKADWFDAVLEPGDLAAPYDQGATRDAPSHLVGPVTLLDRAELEERDVARRALGLPADGPLALISLGAGNLNDTSGDIGAATAALGSLGVGVCVTQTEIAATRVDHAEVHLVRDYPLARRYAAFDLVISASGYNSFQELLRMGVPSLFVPNRATQLDDQEGRARYAADQGWAHQADRIEVESATAQFAELLEKGESMVAGAVRADPGNGAAGAAELILSLADATTVDRSV